MSVPKAPKDHFTLLYFAAATSLTKKQHDFFPAPLPVGKLFALLEEWYHGIGEKVLSSSAVTVNLEYVDMDDEEATTFIIKEGDEVAIIPPVSAG